MIHALDVEVVVRFLVLEWLDYLLRGLPLPAGRALLRGGARRGR